MRRDRPLAQRVSFNSLDCIWCLRKDWFNSAYNALILSRAARLYLYMPWLYSTDMQAPETTPSISLSPNILPKIYNSTLSVFFPPFRAPVLSYRLCLKQRIPFSFSALYNVQSIIWRGLSNYTTYQTDELGMQLEKNLQQPFLFPH